MRADRHTFRVEPADRAAACSHGVELDHRCADSNASDLAFEDPCHFTRVARHVRRSAAHVEADHFGKAKFFGHRAGCHYAGSRAGQNGVAPDEGGCVDQAAVALHHAKLPLPELLLEPPHVLRQQRG